LGHHPSVCLGEIVVRQVTSHENEENHEIPSLFEEEYEFGYE
jgi:hypothetical protein